MYTVLVYVSLSVLFYLFELTPLIDLFFSFHKLGS